jgi:hypothetical protein
MPLLNRNKLRGLVAEILMDLTVCRRQQKKLQPMTSADRGEMETLAPARNCTTRSLGDTSPLMMDVEEAAMTPTRAN